MKCPSCQNDIPDASNFCGFCGHRIQKPAAAAAPAPSATELTGATLIGAPAFPADDAGEDIQATQAMAALGSSEPGDTVQHATVIAESPAPVLQPIPRVETPSVIVDSSVQREAAALDEGVDTARDIADAALLRAVAAAPAEPPKAEPAPAEPVKAKAAEPPRAQPTKAEPAKAAEPARAQPANAEPAQAAEPARAQPTKAEPAKAEPAKAPEPARAQPAKAEPAKAEPAKAKAAEPAKKTTDAPKAKAASKAPAEAPPVSDSGFRETVWFMQSINPEKLGDIEREDPSAVQDLYQKGAPVDEQARKEFSLNQSSPNIRETQLHQARLRLEETASSGGSRAAVLLIVIAVLGGLGAAAWFLFAGK